MPDRFTATVHVASSGATWASAPTAEAAIELLHAAGVVGDVTVQIIDVELPAAPRPTFEVVEGGRSAARCSP